jgi:HD-like signal output (HDOD) protein
MSVSSKEASDAYSWPQLLETAQLVLALIGEIDPGLKAHAERVANQCANFADSLGLLQEHELQHLYLAGLLHVAGFAGQPAAAFCQPPTSDGQSPALNKQPAAAVDILSNHSGFKALTPLVRHHREAFDGSGLPDGKKGADIPLGARILRLCDHFDTLNGDTDEAAGDGAARVLAGMQDKAGSEFDPELTLKFIEFVESKPVAEKGFLFKNQSAFVRQAFAAILQKLSAGKIIPPAMPQVVFELRNVIKRQDSSVKDLADVLGKDPVVSLRLISVAKSPVYKGYGEVKSVQAAIPRLGFKETLSVVVAIANKSMYEAKQPQHRVLMDKMWVHSLACAYASKLIAQSLFLDDSETMFLMGLTHDVGKVVLLRAFGEMPQEQDVNSEVVMAAIQDAHQSTGSLLLKRWGFGDEFLRVMALHEGSNFSEQTRKEILVVHLANMLTRKMGLSFFDWDGQDPADLPSATLLGLSADVIQRVDDKVREIVKEAAHLF